MYPDLKKRNEDTVVHNYIHDIFKEIFRDPNYDIIWANIKSLSSRNHRSSYGRTQGRRPDATLYRIMDDGDLEEECFVEGGINNIISLRGNDPEVKSFSGHFCEIYIFFGMMDLDYDGIYRYFQLSEIKLAQKLSEFNLVRKLIIETFFFKVILYPDVIEVFDPCSYLLLFAIQCRIDSFYANNGGNGPSNKNNLESSSDIGSSSKNYGRFTNSRESTPPLQNNFAVALSSRLKRIELGFRMLI
ncbi:21150_t:CDS:2 [Cetraspora pellucida]|uniref:21150_t:CDS:1 n=1 Tax=Cetraspora pellucida TaxID=1433469 RepID=A0A9N9C7C8_9GLOM|nr:21150_t:CDS:2 [Cetraspora pellucida]